MTPLNSLEQELPAACQLPETESQSKLVFDQLEVNFEEGKEEVPTWISLAEVEEEDSLPKDWEQEHFEDYYSPVPQLEAQEVQVRAGCCYQENAGSSVG